VGFELPSNGDSITVDRSDDQTTALVKRDGWHVVMRRDEPQPPTGRRAGRSLSRSEQDGADLMAFRDS